MCSVFLQKKHVDSIGCSFAFLFWEEFSAVFFLVFWELVVEWALSDFSLFSISSSCKVRYKLIKGPLVLLSIVTHVELLKVCRERSQNQMHNQDNSFSPAHATPSFTTPLDPWHWEYRLRKNYKPTSAHYSSLYLCVSVIAKETFRHGSSCCCYRSQFRWPD